jgi:hypothetical protein
MTKLNQLIAVSKGAKADAQRAITDAYHQVQKTPLLNGLAREYQPRDDEGDRLPSESTKVQYTAQDATTYVAKALTRLLDVQASLDAANTYASANVVVDGEVVLTALPVPTLLFLEKQLADLHTFVGKLPVLDPAINWSYSDAAGHYASDTVQTTRTTKVPRNHVLAPATEKHAAQVQVYYEDVIVGTWNTTRFSGAMPESDRRAMLERVTKLRDAVKMARELANEAEITDVHIGAVIADYLFL